MRRKFKKRASKFVACDGSILKSRLEVTMYNLLTKEGISFEYEGRKFLLMDSFTFENSSYETPMANTKGEFKDRGNQSVRKKTYTPDFVPPRGTGLKWCIETKGFARSGFSDTWKLFKKHLIEEGQETILFMPRLTKHCEEVIKIIKRDLI